MTEREKLNKQFEILEDFEARTKGIECKKFTIVSVNTNHEFISVEGIKPKNLKEFYDRFDKVDCHWYVNTVLWPETCAKKLSHAVNGIPAPTYYRNKGEFYRIINLWCSFDSTRFGVTDFTIKFRTPKYTVWVKMPLDWLHDLNVLQLNPSQEFHCISIISRSTNEHDKTS